MEKAFILNQHKNHPRVCGGPQGSGIPALEKTKADETPDRDSRGWIESKEIQSPDCGFRGWNIQEEV